MKTTDVPFLRGEVMPEPKPSTKAQPAAAPESVPDPVAPAPAPQPGLIPAGAASNPEVHKLLAELATARTNGSVDDADDIIHYLAELGYSAS